MSTTALAWPVVMRPARRTKLLMALGKATPSGTRPRMRELPESGGNAAAGLDGFVAFTVRDCRETKVVTEGKLPSLDPNPKCPGHAIGAGW